MNIFSLLAVIVICITWAATVLVLSKTGITIHRTSADVTKRPEVSTITPAKPDESKKPKDVATLSLDAVIQAANEVMGISVVNQEDNNG